MVELKDIPNIVIQVTIPDSNVMVCASLSQETEEQWPLFIQDMVNGGHTHASIAATIIERIKWLARPYLAVTERPEVVVKPAKAKKPRKPRSPKKTPTTDAKPDDQPTLS